MTSRVGREVNMAELAILDGKYEEALNRLPASNAIWRDEDHNNAGLALFLLRNPKESIVHFHRVLTRDLGPSHLAAAKNLNWVLASLNSNRMDYASNKLVKIFKQSYAAGMQVRGLSIFDLDLQHRICTNAMHNRNRHPKEWDKVSKGDRWRMQYFDLLKKSLTYYLYRDINDWAQSTITTTGNASICTGSLCESDWDVNQVILCSGRLWSLTTLFYLQRVQVVLMVLKFLSRDTL